VRVPKQLQVLNFTPNLPDDIEALDLLPIENFYSNFVARQLMNSNLQQQQQISTVWAKNLITLKSLQFPYMNTQKWNLEHFIVHKIGVLKFSELVILFIK